MEPLLCIHITPDSPQACPSPCHLWRMWCDNTWACITRSLLAFGYDSQTDLLSAEAPVNGSRSKISLLAGWKMAMSFDKW